ELVEIDYETLPPAIDTRQSAETGAPLVWDNTPSNIFLDAEVGDAAATERAFVNAAHVVKLETWVRRGHGRPHGAGTACRRRRQPDRSLFPARRQRRCRASEGRNRHHPRG